MGQVLGNQQCNPMHIKFSPSQLKSWGLNRITLHRIALKIDFSDMPIVLVEFSNHCINVYKIYLH